VFITNFIMMCLSKEASVNQASTTKRASTTTAKRASTTAKRASTTAKRASILGLAACSLGLAVETSAKRIALGRRDGNVVPKAASKFKKYYQNGLDVLRGVVPNRIDEGILAAGNSGGESGEEPTQEQIIARNTQLVKVKEVS
jgi:hypothetical protein